MGREIVADQFSDSDNAEFRARLARETAELSRLVEAGEFDDDSWCFGFELEGWITDQQYRPRSRIQDLMEGVSDDALVPELAAFNFELNGKPVPLQQQLFTRFEANLRRSWDLAARRADELGLHLLMIGVLPTLQPDDLVVENMSPLLRYRALNRQVFAMRGNRALEIDIEGTDHLQMSFQNVMLESAATSMQLHLQLPISSLVRAYNLSKMLSGPMVAASANSPGLFGKRLWDESRIPIFEQSIDVGASDLTRRVTFGIRYLENNPIEAFEANLNRYPVMLPHLMDDNLHELPHLQLHNGTIWRWNRPLLGFVDGRPHFRIEHRVMPSGPSIADIVANSALYFGSLLALLDEPDLEQRMPFEASKANFYRAARQSLQASFDWIDGEQVSAPELLLRLCDLAEMGFERFAIADGSTHLVRMRKRIKTGLHGCELQTRLLEKTGSYQAMLALYEAGQTE